MLVDLTDYVGGSAQMLPKPGRVDKIVASVKAILRSDKLPSGVCANLCGKVEYTASSGACGRVGRAPLSALRAWQHRRSKRRDDEPLPEWLKEALRFFVELLPALPGRKFFFGEKRRKRRPVVVVENSLIRQFSLRPGEPMAAVSAPSSGPTGATHTQPRALHGLRDPP